jgi:glycosyltransferase involved in cell wall biosynthesis
MKRLARRPRSSSSGDEVLVIGPSSKFLSGLAYHTAAISRGLQRSGSTVSTLLVRNLCPRWLYPGREHVGSTPLSVLGYETIPVSEGLDWYWIPSIWTSLAFLRNRRPKIVLVQWWSVVTAHSWILVVWAARMQRSKVVLEVHETNDPTEAKIPLVGGWSRLAIRMMSPAVSAVVLHSADDERLLEDAFPSLVAKPRSVIFPGPLEHAGRVSAPVPLRTRTTGAPVRILFFGLLRSYKGIAELTEAFTSLVLEHEANVFLEIVGEPWDDTELDLRRLEELGGDYVRVRREFVEDDEVLELFRGADVFTAPYRRAHASGPVNLAMAAGLPIVTTKVPALLEACHDYEGAVFAEIGQPTSLADSLLKSLEMTDRRYANPHSWDANALKYKELFARLG